MFRIASLTLAILFAAVSGVPAQSPTLAVPADAPTIELTPTESPIVATPAPHYAAAPAIECCPIEVVDVRTKLSARRFLRCAGAPIDLTACVDNPADCCPKLYAVPLCVPCCCVGTPTPCNARTGLLGRGSVDLVWDCGLVAKVTFLKHGGVIITYRAG